MRPLLRCVAALSVTAITLVTVAWTAEADAGNVTRVSLASDTSFATGTTRILARTVTLEAGESRHVRGRLEATSSMTANAGMNAMVRCVDATGAAVGVTGATSRNHEGSDAGYAIDGHLPLYADLLFTAPTTGAYTCGLYGSTASDASDSYHLTAVAGSTWLDISDDRQVGHWWENPVCSSRGTSSTCRYIGAASTAPVWVFYNDGTPVYTWTAASTATAVQALADLTLTTCYKNTASCDDSVASYEKPRGTNSVVDLRFEVIQLDTTAHTCKLSATTTSRKTIKDEAHHYAAYLSLPRIAIDPTCGTRDFILRVYVDHVSGNPVKIDGRQGDISLTNAIAVNLFN